MLSTPQYQIRKNKKSGILVSPSKVTIVGPVESSEADDSVHAQVHAGSRPSPVPSDMHSSGGFVSRQDLDVLNNQLEEISIPALGGQPFRPISQFCPSET